MLTFIEFILISTSIYFVPYEPVHLGGLGGHRRLGSYAYSSYYAYGSSEDDRIEMTPSAAFSKYKIRK